MRKGKNGDKEGWKLLFGGAGILLLGRILGNEYVMGIGGGLIIVIAFMSLFCWLGGTMDFMDF